MLALWKSIERFAIPPSLVTDWRATFLVRVWGFGTAFGLLFGTLALIQSQLALAAMQFFIVLAGVVIVLLLRTTGRLYLLTHVSLAVNTPFLAFAGLMQNPANPITPVFLVLVPLTANFALGARCMKIWLVISMLFGGLAEWLMTRGVHLDMPARGNPGVITALNLMALVLLVVVFVRWFDNMRRDVVEKLEAASRARTIFLANVSHEIRTPMNGVLGLTELMLADPLEPKQRERVELVQRSGRSLVQLIDDLLLVTRAESGRLVLTVEPTSVHNLACDVVELFTPVANQKGLQLRFELSEALPKHVMLDGVRWRQVLVNLLSNAIKFTERGEVTVRVLRRDTLLVAEVEDQGIGIEPRVLDRLFRPFEQGDDSMTRKYGGSGLGLALSKQLVEAFGGHLSVRSSVGHGSTFTVEVPLIIASVPSRELTPHVPAKKSALSVLVVDDNPINLLVARGLVERAGFKVEVARNGREAVDAVHQQDFALVFMDCQMPEMDGLEATRRIRACARCAATPVIALTASGLPEELEACRQAGMNETLVKPVSLEMVKRALALAR